ncbi:MAG: hypothetical protein NZM08_03275, partial [Chitinophagales bacterium]|nr:hypothetical protein [Chitinophagales bacterium]
PQALVLSQQGNTVKLSWTPAPDSSIIGYQVYRSSSRWGKYIRLTDPAVADTVFVDAAPLNGTNWYLVRAERWEQTPGGTYANLSIGAADSVHVQLTAMADQPEPYRVYPNPAISVILIAPPVTVPLQMTLQTADGKVVWREHLQAGQQVVRLPAALANGYYLAVFSAPEFHQVMSLVIQR